MNIKTESKYRLFRSVERFNDLQECLKQPVSEDCRHYINDEIMKARKNIEYYKEILKLLGIELSQEY